MTVKPLIRSRRQENALRILEEALRIDKQHGRGPRHSIAVSEATAALIAALEAEL